MDFKNLTEDFGVEIRNFDCSKKITYGELNLLKKTIQDRHFICFKNQKLDGDKLATFTKNFGIFNNIDKYFSLTKEYVMEVVR